MKKSKLKWIFYLNLSHYKTISSTFLSELSPGNNPNHYINCILHLKKCLDRINARVPIIFNAMGWLRQLGLSLNLDIIRLCGVDLIYYLKTGTSNDLPDDLQLADLMSCQGFKEPSRYSKLSKILIFRIFKLCRNKL